MTFQKIYNSRYLDDINQMLKDGISARKIEKWLLIHGEKISHALISQYAKTEYSRSPNADDGDSDVENLSNTDKLNKLGREALVNALKFRDNPVKFKAYSDVAFRCLSKAAEASTVNGGKSKYSHLTDEEFKAEMAEGIKRMLTYYHPSFVAPFPELNSETLDEQMEEWNKVNCERDKFKAFIDHQLKPIFAGQLPDWFESG